MAIKKETRERIEDVGREATWLATRDEVMPQADVRTVLDDIPGDLNGERYARLFHGTHEPNYEIAKERPIHRLAACLCAAGMSFTEVGKRLGVANTTVGNWFRQKWFQEFVDQEIMAAGIDPLKNLLAGAAKDSVLTLIELRDTPSTPPSVRCKAAMDLLDRAYGKAPTTVIHSQSNGNALNDLAAVDREINELIGKQ